MGIRYTEEFIEQALIKVYSRGDRTVKSVAAELNVNYQTVKNWMKRKQVKSKVVGSDALRLPEKRPQDWTAEQQLLALHETHGLSGEPLQAWCREHGLFAHHLSSWKAAFCADNKVAPAQREIRGLKDENEQLKRELLRKEKALSEAAALLILQKKFRALWEDEVK
jgi:transposase-like protein